MALFRSSFNQQPAGESSKDWTKLEKKFVFIRIGVTFYHINNSHVSNSYLFNHFIKIMQVIASLKQ